MTESPFKRDISVEINVKPSYFLIYYYYNYYYNYYYYYYYYYYYRGGGLFTAFPKKMALHLLIKYLIVYLTDFWKINLTKFAVI